MSLNHPETIRPSHSMEKLFSMKLVTGAKTLGTTALGVCEPRACPAPRNKQAGGSCDREQTEPKLPLGHVSCSVPGSAAPYLCDLSKYSIFCILLYNNVLSSPGSCKN